jgi:hypothetical protein
MHVVVSLLLLAQPFWSSSCCHITTASATHSTHHLRCCRFAQALSSSYKASGSELTLQHLASEAQSRLLAADALVRKYGHERLFGSLLRLEGREEVEAKFDGTIRELQSITNKVCRAFVL